jgi:hypothetical protein
MILGRQPDGDGEETPCEPPRPEAGVVGGSRRRACRRDELEPPPGVAAGFAQRVKSLAITSRTGLVWRRDWSRRVNRRLDDPCDRIEPD